MNLITNYIIDASIEPSQLASFFDNVDFKIVTLELE